jgi:hypothetical protein
MNATVRNGSGAFWQDHIIETQKEKPGTMTMTSKIQQTVSLSARIMVMASVLLMPVCALAFVNNNGVSAGSQGAGFVLYVSLQNNGVYR